MIKETLLELRKERCVNLSVETFGNMDVASFLERAEGIAGAGAWMLYESVAEAGLNPCAGIDAATLVPCAKVRVFGPLAELRLEKAPGERAGCARIVAEVAEGMPGEAVFPRVQSYIVRGRPEKLVHKEYFKEDEDGSGFLTLFCERLAGLAGGR